MSEPGAKAQRCPLRHFCEVAALIRFVRTSVVTAFASLALAAAAFGSEPVWAQAPSPAAAASASADAATPAATNAGAPTPIPVIVAPTDPPTPVPSGAATPAPSRHGRHRPDKGPSASTPEPTPTPTVPGFATLDGTWEVQLQRTDTGTTDYSYLVIKQSNSTLSGSWHEKKVVHPFSDTDCTFDGKLVHIVATTATGTATFSGYVENGTDMVGIVDFGGKADPIAFTASHRGKDKGIFGPGGLSPAGIPGSNIGGTPNYPH